jgi:hypothetical protein
MDPDFIRAMLAKNLPDFERVVDDAIGDNEYPIDVFPYPPEEFNAALYGFLDRVDEAFIDRPNVKKLVERERRLLDGEVAEDVALPMKLWRQKLTPEEVEKIAEGGLEGLKDFYASIFRRHSKPDGTLDPDSLESELICENEDGSMHCMLLVP